MESSRILFIKMLKHFNQDFDIEFEGFTGVSSSSEKRPLVCLTTVFPASGTGPF